MRRQGSAAQLVGAGRNGCAVEPPIVTHAFSSGDFSRRCPESRERPSPTVSPVPGFHSSGEGCPPFLADDAAGARYHLAATQPVRAVMAAPGSLIQVVRKLSQRRCQAFAEHPHFLSSVAAVSMPQHRTKEREACSLNQGMRLPA
jgi:hypothetical protein